MKNGRVYVSARLERKALYGRDGRPNVPVTLEFVSEKSGSPLLWTVKGDSIKPNEMKELRASVKEEQVEI